MANKKMKPNRYKPQPRSKAAPSALTSKARKLFKTFPVLCFLMIMSLTAVLLHDSVVQSPFFTIGDVKISGLNRVSRNEILEAAGLSPENNLFDVQPRLIEKKLTTLSWIAGALVERHLFSGLSISIEEQTPLAIVTIENLTDLIINTQGIPFKEYDPEKDRLENLPVISGVDLTLSDNGYGFQGKLFNSVMDLLKIKGISRIRTIHGDPITGVLIQAQDVYNKNTLEENGTGPRMPIPITLGFDRFEEKLEKAMDISRYLAALFPDKTILAMDLYDIEQIFIKTEDALHNTLKKGA